MLSTDTVARIAPMDMPERRCMRNATGAVLEFTRQTSAPPKSSCNAEPTNDILQECPSLWRVYEYVTQHERESILSSRREKSTLAFGSGGEGYIAEDEWCYNCGQCGHWGDVCMYLYMICIPSDGLSRQDCGRPHVADRPPGPSAFGVYNTYSGPFAGLDEDRLPVARKPSDWEREDLLPDGWGQDAPLNVGKQGRNRARERLEKQARVQGDDEDDWFGKPRPSRTKNGESARRGSESNGLSNARRVPFALSLKDDPRRLPPSAPRPRHQPPSLLDRISLDDDRPHSRSHHSPSYERDERTKSRQRRDYGPNSRRHDDRRHSNWKEDRDRRSDTRRNESGPRYTGGYSR
jgi:protein AIR1/2